VIAPRERRRRFAPHRRPGLTPRGATLAKWFAAGDSLAAPDCAGVEFGRYLRRHTIDGQLSEADARRSFVALRALRIETYPTSALLEDAFALPDNFTFDDALYVVLARLLDEPLATTDARLQRVAADAGIALATPG
jgi:predicted nucleic acid-binding protein